jgi:archaeal cell division control protein 6
MRKKLFNPQKEESIFKNESALYPEYLPEEMPYRETQIKSLVYAFEPVIKGKKPLNVFLHGPTGVGKTSCIKYVLRELEETTSRAKHLYINCFETSTRASILFRLANFLGCPFPRRGLGTEEAYEGILEFLKKADFVPILVLDEADQLIRTPEETKVIYDLLRVTEYQEKKIGLALISNDSKIVSFLDERIKSSLTEESIEFPAYSPAELKAILSERAKIALFAEAFSKETIDLAAGHAAKLGGDARIAIDSLLKAGRLSERKGKKCIDAQDLKTAFQEVDSASILKSVTFLDPHEKKILNLLCTTNKETTSGKLFLEYSKQENHLNERAFRSRMASLESKKIISRTETRIGNKGKATIITLNAPKDAVKKTLN